MLRKRSDDDKAFKVATPESIEKELSSATGSMPLTVQGVVGGLPIVDYSVKGNIRTNRASTPTSPIPPAFVGTYRTGDTIALALLMKVEGAFLASKKELVLTGVQPLRKLSTTSDVLKYSTQAIERNVGVCREPVVVPGINSTFGTKNPSVTLQVLIDNVEQSYSGVETTHWHTAKRRDFIAGKDVGMSVQSGVFSVNLPRATYRKFVTGAIGTTAAEGVVSNVPAGTYRCDFFDGTSCVFNLLQDLEGFASGKHNLLAISRTSAKLVQVVDRVQLTTADGFEAVEDYLESGKTVFKLAKEDLEGKASATAGCMSTHFTYVAAFDPQEEADVVFQDTEYWYFLKQGVETLEDFEDYLEGEYEADTPVSLVFELDEQEVITLESSTVATADAQDVTLLDDVSGGVTDDTVFDTASEQTLVPAFEEWWANEYAIGRPVEIYFTLPDEHKYTESVTLPTLTAPEGALSFSAQSIDRQTVDPTEGSVQVYIRTVE